MSEEIQTEEISSPLTDMGAKQLLQIGLTGLVVGALVWGLTFVFDTYVFKALLCQGAATAKCATTANYAEITATIIAAGVGLFSLAKIGVFRPLLIALAATASLWGIIATATLLFPWQGVGLACILLYVLGYSACAWVARIKTFWVAAILLLVLVVVVRLLLVG